ncbi:GntR family transcriptional regulator [Mycolicibacterium vaccae]|uniref:GntR family transcriptional regulator n=1 Tax=Mycolicibacterium vaccae TaxID=1810 RepID=UPI003CFDC0FA
MTETSRLSPPAVAFEQLRSWILAGALAPGQRLQVREVATGMGLSTMPVREALIRLEEAGLVTQEPRKGAVVARLSIDDLRDYYDLRQIIEPQSLQMGVERMTPERLARLRATMTALEEAVAEGDLVTTLDLDEQVLLLIHGAVANKHLTRVIKSIWTRVRPYKLLWTTTAQVDAGAYIAEEDARFVAIAEARDGAHAHELMIESLVNAKLRLSDLLRSHDSGPMPSRVKGDDLVELIAALARGHGARVVP